MKRTTGPSQELLRIVLAESRYQMIPSECLRNEDAPGTERVPAEGQGAPRCVLTPTDAGTRQNRWEQGWLTIDPRVYDQLDAMQIPLADAGKAIEAALGEITAADAKSPDFQFDPPGQGFVWQSGYFRCQMYLKVRLEDARPRCKLYSLHQSLHTGTAEKYRKARAAGPRTAES